MKLSLVFQVRKVLCRSITSVTISYITFEILRKYTVFIIQLFSSNMMLAWLFDHEMAGFPQIAIAYVLQTTLAGFMYYTKVAYQFTIMS